MAKRIRNWAILCTALAVAACTTEVGGKPSGERDERSSARPGASAGAGADTSAADESPSARPDRPAPAERAEPLEYKHYNDSSDPAIVLRWDEQPDEVAGMELRGRVLNTTAEAIEVRLAWFANGLIDRVVSRPIATVTVPAKGSVPLQLNLADAPVQSHESATMTTVLAHYTDPDGWQAQEMAPPRYVTYREDYAQATVRSWYRQGVVGGERALQPPPTHRVRGKYYDAARDALVEDEKAHDAKLAAEPVVVLSTGVAILPDMPEIVPSDDAMRSSPIAQKAASITICPTWQYAFRDAGRGEDLLLHGDGNSGRIPARRNTYLIGNSSGALGWGTLNSSGCTAALALAPGTWSFALLPGVSKDGIEITAYPTSNRETWGFTGTFSVSTNQVKTVNFFFGLGDPVASAAVVATQLLHHADRGMKASKTRIFAAEPCPNPPKDCDGSEIEGTAGCQGTVGSERLIWLGPDNNDVFRSFNKYIVGHELGHAQADIAFASFDSSYCPDAPPSDLLCRCDFVTSSNKTHCLNSRERIGAAQSEGWGHFFATALVNNRGETSCNFTYYKEMITPWGLAPAPLAINCAVQSAWRDQFCFSNDTGTELDWLAFYWLLYNDNGSSSSRRFSFSNFAALYDRACGADNECTDNDTTKEVTFSKLRTAANTEFGAGSAKATHFINSGALAGVDN